LIIDRDLARYLVFEEESVRHVLVRIDENDEGMVVCLDGAGVLLGLLTDGDIRRWMLSSGVPDLEVAVGLIVNREVVTAPVEADPATIEPLFDSEVRVVPLVDERGRCVALAWPRGLHFAIAGRRISRSDPCFVIGEIGNNHNGDLDTAFRLIDECAAAGADCIKFQVRHLSTLYANSGDSDDNQEDLGSQYVLDLLSRYQLSNEEMAKALDRVREVGAIPLVTPWDSTSLRFLVDFGVPALKTASADFTNTGFLREIASTGLPMVCSTGMSTEDEIRQSVGVLRGSGAQFALLHCNSTYPAPFKDVNLRYMDSLREFGYCPVGYSSHDRGIATSIAAVALGADILEKHVTLDKEMEGSDHRISLLPSELAEMVAGIREVEAALGDARPRRLSQGEMMNRESLGKSLMVTVTLSPGDVIEEHVIEARSPGRGLSPNRIGEVVGTVVTREIPAGGVLFPSDLDVGSTKARDYAFDRPFGIPIRYHDLIDLGTRTNLDLLEFHLSYKDLEVDETAYLDDVLDLDLLIHAPELFEGDHVLDLCSLDQSYRDASIAHLGRVVDLTRRLAVWFGRVTVPRIIVNVGGFTQDAPLAEVERASRYEMVVDGLAQLDLVGVEVIPQTMPPYPWHFGGQRFQNLFMDPRETAEFCEKHEMRICLDTSHSKLACTKHRWSFSEFLRALGPYTSHLHIADASGVDGEGLQIREGEIDFPLMGAILREVAPDASFIPEIWQGHKNGGEGFWRALELLEGDL
jgi:N-acetylneuraminate synthase